MSGIHTICSCIGLCFILLCPLSTVSGKPFVFPVETITAHSGGPVVLLLGYLNSDREVDYLLAGDRGFTAYDHSGRCLWKLKEESTFNQRKDPKNGTTLSYHATCGVIGNRKFYFVRKNQTEVVTVDGATGDIKQVLDTGPVLWTDVGLGHLFSPAGPEDLILLQDGYIGGFTGYRSTNKVGAVKQGRRTIAWIYETPPHQGIAFAHMRVGDVDADGFDEICTGRLCIDNDGKTVLMRLVDPVWGRNPLSSYTTLQLGDLFPEHPGLELFAGHYFIGRYGVHSFVYGSGRFLKTYKSGSNVHSAVIGNCDLKPGWKGPEVLVRSNKDGENRPPDVRRLRFLNLATGEEVIQAHIPENSWRESRENGRPRGSYPRFIDWDGDADYEVCLVERHCLRPRASVNNARTGACLMETAHRGLGEAMVRIFDVTGDGREEVIVWNDKQIAVYGNEAPAVHVIPTKRYDRAYLLRSRHGSFVYNYPQ